MRYTVEESLENFKAWSGAVATLNKLREINGGVEIVEDYINECMIEPSETDINDFLWFESEYIFTELLEIPAEEN